MRSRALVKRFSRLLYACFATAFAEGFHATTGVTKHTILIRLKGCRGFAVVLKRFHIHATVYETILELFAKRNVTQRVLNYSCWKTQTGFTTNNSFAIVLKGFITVSRHIFVTVSRTLSTGFVTTFKPNRNCFTMISELVS